MINSRNTIAIPPGYTIREQLDNREMSQKEFAIRMGMSEKHISRLINGKVELTPDVALKLESVLGIPANFWMNLESLYREDCARVEQELSIEKDEQMAANFPYSKLVNLSWVAKTSNFNEKVKNLRAFFEVSELGLLEKLRVPGISYKVNSESLEIDYSLVAWAQKAKMDARYVDHEVINLRKLKKLLPDIRDLIRLSPNEFCSGLQSILLSCGVVIVFLPHIDGSFLHGATFYDGDHIVLGLTGRGKDSDKFWFSLFHELHHIIENHISNDCLRSEAEELNADEFAKNFLINDIDYSRFIENGKYNKVDIVEFASEIGITPGIVLGRLQKDKLVPYDRFRDLKEQLSILEYNLNN